MLIDPKNASAGAILAEAELRPVSFLFPLSTGRGVKQGCDRASLRT